MRYPVKMRQAMNFTITRSYRQLCLFAAVISVTLVLSSHCLAIEYSSFVQEFIHNYDQQNFNEQVKLVNKNKDLIPATITELTKQALSEKLGFDEKMNLLNIASSMAYMHFHWNGDRVPLDALDTVIAREVENEQQKRKIVMEEKKGERFIGNFVMSRHEKEMKAEGLPMVLYPHWLHRTMFECKVCHNSIFKMKRWVNNISQENIIKGEQCGVCHNGTMAFSARENCQRCHLVGKPEAEKLHKPASVSQAKIKQAAERVGAKWRPENLPDGKLPLDKFQFINWLELKRLNVFTPIVSLDKDYQEEIRDNKILFKSKSDFVNDVVFDHKIHSDWINCDSCHPAIFKDKLGGSDIKMMEMQKGRACGNCHGRVSFTFADCKRCHKESNSHPSEAVLIR